MEAFRKIAGLPKHRIAVDACAHLKTVDSCFGVVDRKRERLLLARCIRSALGRDQLDTAAASIERSPGVAKGTCSRVVPRRARVPRVRSRSVCVNQDRNNRQRNPDLDADYTGLPLHTPILLNTRS